MKEFIKGGGAARFSSLRVKYVKGAAPVLKLLDGTDTIQDSLSLDKWDTDTIAEFLREKLH